MLRIVQNWTMSLIDESPRMPKPHHDPEHEPIAPDLLPRLDPNRFWPETRKRLSAPGLRTLLAIADLWHLTRAERLMVLGSAVVDGPCLAKEGPRT